MPSRRAPPLVVLLLLAATPARAAGTTELASVGPGGRPARGNSEMPGLSGDGRFVVFNSDAADLAAVDPRSGYNDFLRDRETGATLLVSVSSAGVPGDDVSTYPVVSRDGHRVAFCSFATNLVPGGPATAGQVLVRDLAARTTRLVSAAPGGAPADALAFPYGVTPGGRLVLFGSEATNLVPGATGFNYYVRDLATGALTLESRDPAGRPAGGSPFRLTSAAITPDGHFVAFSSDAAGLVPGGGNGRTQVFLRERLSGRTALVSVARDGGPADGDSLDPFVSDDGGTVAFDSFAPDLAPGRDTNGQFDAFVRDVRAGVTRRIDFPVGGGQTRGETHVAGLSADGRYVLLVSDVPDLVRGDGNGVADVFVHDRRTRTTVRASVGAAGGPGDGESGLGGAALSADGRAAAFASVATNLVPHDRNGPLEDVFVRVLNDRPGGREVASGVMPGG